jgi:hypothetical protein
MDIFWWIFSTGLLEQTGSPIWVFKTKLWSCTCTKHSSSLSMTVTWTNSSSWTCSHLCLSMMVTWTISGSWTHSPSCLSWKAWFVVCINLEQSCMASTASPCCQQWIEWLCIPKLQHHVVVSLLHDIWFENSFCPSKRLTFRMRTGFSNMWAHDQTDL